MKLLKFSATWCGPCKHQKAEFEAHPLDIPLEEYDVDDENAQDLVKKHNVRSIPTMVLVDDKGETLNRWVGITQSETINNYVKDYKS